jgi:rubredoxin
LNEQSEKQLSDMANELCGICAGDQCEIDAPAVKKFVCKVCGYVYEGEELPEDYRCPICNVKKNMFIEQA